MGDIVFAQLVSTAAAYYQTNPRKKMRSSVATPVWTCTDSGGPYSRRKMFLILHDIFFFQINKKLA